MSEQRQTAPLSAVDWMLLGNNYLQSVFVLRPDTFFFFFCCLRICGSGHARHTGLCIVECLFAAEGFSVGKRKRDAAQTQTHLQ